LAKSVGMEDLGVAQKRVMAACKGHGIPFIVATGLLESMVEENDPKRAEVSDITHAVENKADYLLLANETAVGKYPVEATSFLKKVIAKAA